MDENQVYEAEVTNEEQEEGLGNIKIAVDVVATIAGIAASGIEGVASMYSSIAGGIAEMLGAKKNPSKGIKVDMKDNSVVIDIYIVVDYGVKIPELAWEIQETVKNSVETMTGLTAEKINIHIEGVSFAKEKAKEEEEAAAAAAEEAAAAKEADIEEIPEPSAEDEVPPVSSPYSAAAADTDAD